VPNYEKYNGVCPSKFVPLWQKKKRTNFFGIVDKDEFWQKSVQCLIRVSNTVTAN
jgi:hypothetical protein